MRKIQTLLCLTIFLFLPVISQADPAFTQRRDVQQFINEMTKQHHFSKTYLLGVMNQVTLQPQIIESMERPYEKKTWDVYKALFLTPQRLQAGLQFWQANQKILAKAEQQYQVPASIIVSILGVETLYGERQGNYRVLDALATLAFNYPKRAPFFRKELQEYLILCREHGVHPTQYMGSYAGAMGVPQFMPSSYRHFAANFSGHPKKDLMHDNEAVIASVANYFHQHGWQLHAAVAQTARVQNRKVSSINTNYKQAVYTASQLAAAGVHPAQSLAHAPAKMGLIALETARGLEYWLAYPNFYVITRYNSSPLYAMAVYLLALQLQQQMATQQGKRIVSL